MGSLDVIVTGGADGCVRVFGAADGERRKEMRGHTMEVYAVAYAEEQIVSAAADSTVRVWSWAGEARHVLHGHVGLIRALHLSPWLCITAGDKRRICVWDVRTGVQRYVMHRNPRLVHCIGVTDTALVVAAKDTPGVLTGARECCGVRAHTAGGAHASPRHGCVQVLSYWG